MSSAKAPAIPPAISGPPARREVGEVAIPIAVLAIVVALITPLPGFMLDFLIVADIMLSVTVMMVAMNIKRPVEFSVFPTTLLLMTLFRLALNVSSTRLILTNGNTGTSAAGHVIEAFGSFVVGGNYVIGAVIFLVLNAIQYLVINHGAVRISEVTARFTLDAMPGKQMSIDADLNAGLIDENEARQRRRQLASEAEFYGAMDGASRFTQRDAVASILITAINILAGFLIGVLQHGMGLRHALETYTVLTIGDGLVTVIPALMISVSGGLIVTQANSDSRLGAEVQQQVFGKTQPLFLGAGVVTALAALPGFPALPFLLIGGGLGAAAWRLRRKLDAAAEVPTPPLARQAKESLDALLQVEPVAIEIGLGLVSLVEGGQSSPLLQRITAIRRQIAGQLGYVLPTVKVNDNLSLLSREYVVLLKGAEIARFELPLGQELAIPTGKTNPALEGAATKDPAFGLAAWWIKSERAELARTSGYTVVDPVSILGTHFAELIRRHAHELFTRQDAKNFCDRVAQQNPKLVEDLAPKLLSLAVIQRVMQNLLRERVSIRDGVTILEALSEAGGMTKNSVLLTEYVRQALRRTIIKPFLGSNQEVPAYFFDAAVEKAVESAVEDGEHTSVLSLPPQKIREIVGRVSRKLEMAGAASLAIASSSSRHFLRQILETTFPTLAILSLNEVPPEVKVRSLGVID
ncbi:MAG: flagellar biosynthesis protein FlhA [Acidobacteria bacterium]|nr:flagellar biosynthesis protein FlhA [Acidobacteriota bacterium]MBI3472021.1 flagellar biosynthesis protein FlhA [Candidatus Solibacter usitatus]